MPETRNLSKPVKRKDEYGYNDIRDIHVKRKIARYKARLKAVIDDTRRTTGYCDYCERVAVSTFTSDICDFHRDRLLAKCDERKAKRLTT